MLRHDGSARLRREADETLAVRKAYLADGLAVEADGRGERQVTEVRLGQVDRARIGVETFRDEVDDVPEGLPQVVRPRDNLCDVGEQGNAIRNGSSPLGADRPSRRRPHDTQVDR
jgi:hypothetical protein